MRHNLLIVDDELQIQQGLFDFFSDETDFSVSVAGSGEQGLEMIMHSRPTVCIVDMRLPGMTGNEFIKSAMDRVKGCLFIIHTGSMEYELPQDLKDRGITKDNVFIKPVSDMRQFLDFIDRYPWPTKEK